VKPKYKVGDTVIVNGFESEMSIFEIIKPFWRDDDFGYLAEDRPNGKIGFYLAECDIIEKSPGV